MDVYRPRLQQMKEWIFGRSARRLVLTALCGAFAPVAWTAPRPQIPIWNAPDIDKVCGETLSKARGEIAALERLPLSQATLERVFGTWNRMQILIEDTQGPVEILTNVSPDPATRTAGESCQLKINDLGTELFQNEKIYAHFQRIAPTDRIDRKLKKDVVEGFEDTGVALPPEKRARMKLILQRLEEVRQEIASLYGLPSYAHFVTRRRMVESPETVHRFLDEVESKVREVERREIGELRAFKAERLGKSVQEATLNRWDLPYYQEQLKRARYNIDQEALRAYFPTDASVAWVFAVSGSLYGVRFVPAKAPLWHPSVRYYEVIDGKTGMFLSSVYLDLFPRDGKYGHAAAFGVRSVSLLARRTPISVLVANLDRNGLNHRELETLLHEFGHILHGVLSRTRY